MARLFTIFLKNVSIYDIFNIIEGMMMMKKMMIVFSGLLAVGMAMSCASKPAAQSDTDPAQRNAAVPVDFSLISGKTWSLLEIKNGTDTKVLDRSDATTVNWFTLTFGADQFSGMGGPNRYQGPYTLGDAQALSFGPAASTLMAPFIELDAVKEYEYFAYLGKVTKWDISNGRLSLFTTNEADSETVLVFSEVQQ
jgi:heat shock protein HslJ